MLHRSRRPLVVIFLLLAAAIGLRWHPWTKHAIVINIPPQANVISFGCLLSGRGLVWIDDVQLAEADPSTATTAPPMRRLQPVSQTYAAWPPPRYGNQPGF